MNNPTTTFHKGIAVVESCETLEQLDVAERYITLLRRSTELPGLLHGALVNALHKKLWILKGTK